jgi:CubicO group peptidase (beta-lactamase class C family)
MQAAETDRAALAPRIEGDCDPAFRRVRDAFAANFAERGEIGGAVCAVVGGRTVVDVWGGFTDESRRRAWQRDTLVNVYSVGKGITSLLALRLVEARRLRLDEPAARRWPELAAAGKHRLSLRMLLAHRAGLPAVREPLPEGAWADWDRMTAALAAQAPFWEPGTDHGYHTNTFGFLVGELVRRETGLRFGAALREHLTGPVGADFHVGLARAEHARVATLCGHTTLTPTEPMIAMVVPGDADPERARMLRHTYFNPLGLSGGGAVNTSAWRLAEIPSTNGHATARAVAAVYAAALDGSAGIGPGLLAEARSVQSHGLDRVIGRDSCFGLGFQLSHPGRHVGGPPPSFGHFGHGGSLGFADPDAGIAFGCVTNLPGPRRWHHPRTDALVEAVYASL